LKNYKKLLKKKKRGWRRLKPSTKNSATNMKIQHKKFHENTIKNVFSKSKKLHSKEFKLIMKRK
jgi:hypothetical protein